MGYGSVPWDTDVCVLCPFRLGLEGMFSAPWSRRRFSLCPPKTDLGQWNTAGEDPPFFEDSQVLGMTMVRSEKWYFVLINRTSEKTGMGFMFLMVYESMKTMFLCQWAGKLRRPVLFAVFLTLVRTLGAVCCREVCGDVQLRHSLFAKAATKLHKMIWTPKIDLALLNLTIVGMPFIPYL